MFNLFSLGIEAVEETLENDSAENADHQVNPGDKILAPKNKFVCEICEKSFARKDCLVQVIKWQISVTSLTATVLFWNQTLGNSSVKFPSVQIMVLCH